MNTAASNASSPESPLPGIDLKTVVDRAKRIITDPVGGWSDVKGYSYDFKGVIIGYAAVLGVIPAVAGFIHSCIIGYGGLGITVRLSFFSALQLAVVTYLQSLLMVAVAAFVLEAVMPKVGGTIAKTPAAKLVAFAGTAAAVASIGNVIPYLGWFIMLAGTILSIYTYWNGFKVMVDVPADKRNKAFALSTVAVIVAGFVIGLVLSIITPRPDFSMHGKVEVNGHDLTDTLKQLQNLGNALPHNP
jgi:hypothetical protein